jgi:hypothetical protein
MLRAPQPKLPAMHFSTLSKKLVFGFLAELIFCLHIVAVVVIHLGWLFPEYRLAYLIFLVLVLAQHFILGYCVFTPWEFYFRREIDPNFSKPKTSFTATYMKRFFGVVITERSVNIYSASFLVSMIVLQSILLFYR